MNIFSNIGLIFTTFFVWTSIISLPLILTYNDLYLSIFPIEFSYQRHSPENSSLSTNKLSYKFIEFLGPGSSCENSFLYSHERLYKFDEYYNISAKKFPSSLGLILGISTVMIGHFFSLLYFYIFKNIYNPTSIQKIGDPKYIFTPLHTMLET